LEARPKATQVAATANNNLIYFMAYDSVGLWWHFILSMFSPEFDSCDEIKMRGRGGFTGEMLSSARGISRKERREKPRKAR
jgi:hypothetical protein